MPRGGSRTRGRKLNYPKQRKSPHKHKVKPHTRSGRPVGQYERGRGSRPKQNSRQRRVVGNKPTGFKNFTVMLEYYTRPVEMRGHNVSSYKEAISSGILQRDTHEYPFAITVRGVE